ncbi:MAG: hypothetical protein WDN04_16670 [Rhodospirillales bacterium]
MSSTTQFSADLVAYSGGQTLTGNYQAAVQSPPLGKVGITFSDDTHATLVWPGGTVPIQRYDFGPGGSAAAQPANTPQAGLWWNSAEGGRGYTLEVQGGTIYFAGYMYDASGNPIWYLATGPMASPNLFQGQWTQYANGQTLTGAYKAAAVINANVGSISLQFSDTTHATLTLPDGRQIQLGRFNFGFTDPVAYSTAAGAALAKAAELTAVTHHQVVIGGNTLNYTAIAGHMNALALNSGAPEASFFYVAYTLDGQNAAIRPVTFFYNGGPGSSTVWLHLGSFSPKRLVTGDPATNAATPFPLVDNADSLIDVTDLVFVDAVGTGLSEAILPNVNQTFWGVDVDAAVFRDFIMRYLAVNNRNASPKFLFGESYGTPRSAVLANLLESAGVQLGGVVLQSSILNYNSNCGVVFPASGPCTGYLPSYGAVGAWYGLDNPNPTDIAAYMATMRTFSASQYAPALGAYLGSGTQPASSPAHATCELHRLAGVRLALEFQPRSRHFSLQPDTQHIAWRIRYPGIGAVRQLPGERGRSIQHLPHQLIYRRHYRLPVIQSAIHQHIRLRAGKQCDQFMEFLARRAAVAGHGAGPGGGVCAKPQPQAAVGQRLSRRGHAVLPDRNGPRSAGHHAQRADAVL